jgi:di/tricarboxylate transporter
MTLAAGFALALILLMIVCLALELARPEYIILFVLSLFILTGVVSPAEALKGFSNQELMTIALLFVVAGAVQQSGALHTAVKKILGSGTRPRWTLVRMMGVVTAFSAFINNTPIVVMLLSEIKRWCRSNGVSPSKFLIPLSYAAVFGGTLTLIGTSTNLVVQGLLVESGHPGMTMFQIGMIGLPAAVVGILYMATVGYRLLPSRPDVEDALASGSREYLISVRVAGHCPVVGKTIEEAGLRSLTGLYLFEIVRGGEIVTPVPASEKIQAGDRLIFTGIVSTIAELQTIRGLEIETDNPVELYDLQNGDAQLVEAVISSHSSLLNKTVKQVQFRSRYDAAVVAVFRDREQVRRKIGDIVLRPGDTILLLTGKEFEKRSGSHRDFYVITDGGKNRLFDRSKMFLVVPCLLAVVLLPALQVMSTMKTALLAVLVLTLGQAVRLQEIAVFVPFRILLLIAGAFGIGAALDETGVDEALAGIIVDMAPGLDKIALVLIIYLITNLLTELITNSAAAAIVFPIALSLAQQTGTDPMAFILPLTMAASAGFASPIGYQTHLLVYGPGGYRFGDFVKVGVPLNLLFMLTTVILVRAFGLV